MTKALKAAVIGLIVIAIGASVSKAILGLVALLVMSVMCTGGIALVVWIPVLMVVGSAVITGSVGIGSLIAAVSRTNGEKEESVSESKEAIPTPIYKGQIAIERYIERAKSYGLGHAKILSALKNSGWSDAEIQKAYTGYPAPQ